MYCSNAGLTAHNYYTLLEEEMIFREIIEEDVHKALFYFNGTNYKVSEFIGQILHQDVGKRVYLVDGILQVENDDQRNKRTGK